MGFRYCSDNNLLYSVKIATLGTTGTEGLLDILIFWVFGMLYIICILGYLPASWTELNIFFFTLYHVLFSLLHLFPFNY